MEKTCSSSFHQEYSVRVPVSEYLGTTCTFVVSD
ncbi:hypothetical protein T4C_9917 [Trichinella pseudospiralis]|uniref:Uncharacterized protein n=1 Tax=Trichinella pseudospiralis TaxID=6337 RepID=A0A0V1GJW1_TRIPS|nr:hypothetical protein T4C_9917 [Trichinella pseudospiralis]